MVLDGAFGECSARAISRLANPPAIRMFAVGGAIRPPLRSEVGLKVSTGTSQIRGQCHDRGDLRRQTDEQSEQHQSGSRALPFGCELGAGRAANRALPPWGSTDYGHGRGRWQGMTTMVGLLPHSGTGIPPRSRFLGDCPQRARLLGDRPQRSPPRHQDR